MFKLVLLAHGSSYNGAVVMSGFLSRYMKARIYSYTPADFMYSCHSLACEDRKRCMVIVVIYAGRGEDSG